MYENLWHKTASVLEHEIPKNSMAKVISSYISVYMYHNNKNRI